MSKRPSGIVTLCLALLLLVVGAAQTENQAGLVVRFGDDQVETYCVAFPEEEITGRELLERSGLALEFDEIGMGASLCRMEEVGCAASNCFCQCRGGTCEYWSYWLLRDPEWHYSASGASITPVRHGDVQGWSWGPGSVTEAISPPEMAFDEVCATDDSEETVSTPEPEEVSNLITPEVTVGRTPTTVAWQEEETPSVPVSYLFFGLLILLLAVLGVAVGRRRRT